MTTRIEKMLIAALAAVVAVFVLYGTPAFPQTSPPQANNPCAPRLLVIERLAEQYGETRQSMGLHANGGVLEVYASPGSGTWTIIITMPNGISCLVAAGENWDNDAPSKVKPGDDV